MRQSLILLALALSTTASAVPLELTHQGRLHDSGGVALTGQHDVDIKLFDAPASGTELWADTFTALDFEDGYYTIMLGSGAALEEADFDGDDVYLEIAIDSGPPLTRTQVVSVPFAIRANHSATAETAENLDGGVVDASEIRVNGTTIIDSSGTLTVAEGALSALSCSTGEVPTYDGTDWQCGPNPASHTHDATEIDNGVLDIARIPVGGGSTQVAAGDHGHDYNTLNGLPTTLTSIAGGCSDGQVAEYASGAWSCADDDDTQVTNGTGLDLASGVMSVNQAQVENWATAAVSSSGDYVESTDGTADNLTVTGGAGITGGATVAGGLAADTATIGSTSTANGVLTVLGSDATSAGLHAYGDSQGSGHVYVGQSLAYGAGMLYNGDDVPDMMGGGDDVIFFRRNAGTDSEVMSYRYNDGDVHFANDIIVGDRNAAQNHTLSVVANNANVATIEARGAQGQGTGYFYAGQSVDYGGGFTYDGDGTPNVVGPTDDITFFRRNNGVDAAVMSYSYNSNFVTFHGGHTAASDARLKRDIKPMQGALDTVLSLDGVEYFWRDQGRGTGLQQGFLAQDVQRIAPHLVREDGDGFLSVNYEQMAPYFAEAIEELDIQNQALQDENDDLRDELDAVYDALDALEARMDRMAGTRTRIDGRRGRR